MGAGTGALLRDGAVQRAYLGYVPGGGAPASPGDDSAPGGALRSPLGDLPCQRSQRGPADAGVAQELAFGLFAGSIYGIAPPGWPWSSECSGCSTWPTGELLLLSGYGSFWLFALLGIDPFVSLLLVVPGLFLLGVALDGLVFRRLASLEGEERVKSSLLVSFGLTLILQHAMQQLFTADERTVSLGYAGSVASAFGVALPATRSSAC